MTTDLTAAWTTAVAAAGCRAAPERVAALGDRLLQRWAEPHRRYHDPRHLQAVLDGLDRLTAPAAPPAAVRLAAWFHDAVYQGRPGDDERASAALAQEVLTALAAPAGLPEEVARLVLITADHVVAGDDPDAALLVDADLAILAAAPGVYADYARAVREEYAHLEPATFTAGRRAVLAALLERAVLFQTSRGAQLWEAAARANLAAELSLLLPGGPSAEQGPDGGDHDGDHDARKRL